MRMLMSMMPAVTVGMFVCVNSGMIMVMPVTAFPVVIMVMPVTLCPVVIMTVIMVVTVVVIMVTAVILIVMRAVNRKSLAVAASACFAHNCLFYIFLK